MLENTQTAAEKKQAIRVSRLALRRLDLARGQVKQAEQNLASARAVFAKAFGLRGVNEEIMRRGIGA
jgi:hypothetical protein